MTLRHLRRPSVDARRPTTRVKTTNPRLRKLASLPAPKPPPLRTKVMRSLLLPSPLVVLASPPARRPRPKKKKKKTLLAAPRRSPSREGRRLLLYRLSRRLQSRMRR